MKAEGLAEPESWVADAREGAWDRLATAVVTTEQAEIYSSPDAAAEDAQGAGCPLESIACTLQEDCPEPWDYVCDS